MADHSTQAGRLLAVLDLRGVPTRTKFAEEIGVSPSGITAAVKRNEITRMMALAVEASYGVSAEWILTGEGPIEPVSRHSLDLQMYVAFLPKVRELDRRVMDKLAQTFFDRALAYGEQAQAALKWLSRKGGSSEMEIGFSTYMLADEEAQALHSEQENAHRSLLHRVQEVSRMLWVPAFIEVEPFPWGDVRFEKSAIQTLRHRVFIDCVKTDLQTQWEQEAQSLSDEQRRAVDQAYQYAVDQRAEAEKLFAVEKFGRAYAERALWDLDPETLEMRKKLTDEMVLRLWHGEQGPEETYKQMNRG